MDSGRVLVTTLLPIGFMTLALFGVNIWQLAVYTTRAKAEGAGAAPRLGRIAWAISVVAILVAWIAPVSLIMAAVELRRDRGDAAASYHRIPSRMALVNSLWAILAGAIILYMFVFR